MKVTVKFHGELRKYNEGREAKVLELPEGATVYDALHRSRIPLDQIALVARNGARVEWNEPLRDGDELKVYQFAIGG
ncbi:MAG: MoaD/ThiS family protein [candidate division KSB1 bacterium]|nr:MoaD/ThiS family protein [candidate division KSB1 bacterium]